MSLEEFRGIINNMGKYLLKIVFFNGGESLVHKDAYKMIRYAYDNSAADIDITTNMSFKVSDQDMKTLARCCNTVNVCLDGVTQETHEKNRVGGSFKKAYDNMLRLKEIVDSVDGRCTVGWNFIPFSHNEHEIEAAMQMADEAGVYFVLVPPLVIDESWLPKNPALWRSHDSNRGGEQFADISASPDETHSSIEIQGQSFESGEGKQPCSMLYGATVINWDLQITHCCNSQEKKIPVVRSSDFMDTYNGDRYLEIRENGCASCTKSLFRDQNGTVDASGLDMLQGILSRLDQLSPEVRVEYTRYSEGQFLNMISRGQYKGYVFTKYMTAGIDEFPFIDTLGSHSPVQRLFLAAAAMSAKISVNAYQSLAVTDEAIVDDEAYSVAVYTLSILMFLELVESLANEGTPTDDAISALGILPGVIQGFQELNGYTGGLQEGQQALMALQSKCGEKVDEIRGKLMDALLIAGKMCMLSKAWKAPEPEIVASSLGNVAGAIHRFH